MVAQNLEIISEYFHFSTRRTSIFMGFILSTMFLTGTQESANGMYD